MADLAIVVASATITAGQTLSSEFDIGAARGKIVAISWPARGNAATIKLKVAEASGETPQQLENSDGSGEWEVSSGTSAGRRFVPDLAPFRFGKVELSASQASDYVVNFIGRG